MSKLSTIFTTVATHGKTLAKTAMTVAKGHSPVIFAGTAIVGAVAIAYTTYKCTPKYKQAVAEAEQTVKVDEYGSTTVERKPMPKKEKAKIFVKTMWPMMVAIIVTCSSIVMSHKMSAKKIALMSAAYTTATQKASEAAEKKAEEFIKDKLGDDAAKEYREKVDKEHEENDKVCASASSSPNHVYETGGGDDLILDYNTGVVFTASEGYIYAKLDAINGWIRSSHDDCITYADVMSDIVPGFPDIGFALREGFWVNGGNGDYPLSVEFTPGFTADKKPCRVMRFVQTPGVLSE
jgi:hypothetical protein